MIVTALTYTTLCVIAGVVIMISLMLKQQKWFSFFGVMTIILLFIGGLVLSANLSNLVRDGIDVKMSLEQGQYYYIHYINEESNVLMMQKTDSDCQEMIGPEFLYKYDQEFPEKMKAGKVTKYISGYFHFRPNLSK